MKTIYSQLLRTRRLLVDFIDFCFGIAPPDGFKHVFELSLLEANSEWFNL